MNDLKLIATKIGCTEYKLPAIVTNAMAGGISGSAFDSEWYLIDGAMPHWNIFASVSPGKWVVKDDIINLRLRSVINGGYTTLTYLGEEYNHNAQQPYCEMPTDILITSSGADAVVYFNEFTIEDSNRSNCTLAYFPSSNPTSAVRVSDIQPLSPITSLIFENLPISDLETDVWVCLCDENGSSLVPMNIANIVELKESINFYVQGSGNDPNYKEAVITITPVYAIEPSGEVDVSLITAINITATLSQPNSTNVTFTGSIISRDFDGVQIAGLDEDYSITLDANQTTKTITIQNEISLTGSGIAEFICIPSATTATGYTVVCESIFVGVE